MSERTPLSPREHLSAALSLAPRALRAAWIGGIVFAIGLSGTIAWTLSTPRLYRSEAVVVHERGVRSGALGGLEGDTPREVATRLQDMLMARQRLERAIKELKLYPRIVEHRGLGEAIEEMRRHITLAGREGFTFRVSYDAVGRELAQNVLDWLLKGVVDEDAQRRIHEADETKHFLDAERKHADEDMKIKEGALATFLTQHPQLASEVGGGASAGGLIRAADRDRAPAGGGGEVASLEMQAAQLEEALATAGRPGAGPGAPNVDPLLTAAQGRAHADVQSAQHDLAEKQAHFTNEHPDVKASLRRLADAEAAQRRADAAVQSAVRAGAGAGAAAAEDSGSGARVSALRRALSAVRSQIAAVSSRNTPRAPVPQAPGSLVAIDTEWTRLNRDVTEARDRQSQLEAKQFQAELTATLASGGQSGRLVVVDPPYRPMRPIAGGRFKIAVVGAVASLVLSLVAIFLLAAFDDRLYGPRDIERIVNDGIIVVIPKLTGKSPPVADGADKKRGGGNGAAAVTALVPQEVEGGICFVRFAPQPPFDDRLVFWRQGDSESAAAYRLLRQRLIERGDPRSVLCTSASRGEGATTLATNLALAFAELDRFRVLLIEATFRRASLGEMFGFKPPKGFAGQLARHRANPNDPWVVVQIGSSPLYVLAAEPRCCPHCAAVIAADSARFCGMCGKDIGGAAAGALDAVTFAAAIKRFRSAFDYQVVDAPPVLAGGDVNLIQDAADAVVFSVRKGQSESRDLRRALDQVAPAPVAAVVMMEE